VDAEIIRRQFSGEIYVIPLDQGSTNF